MSEAPVQGTSGRGGTAPGGAVDGEERFLMHLSRAGDLIGVQRFEEAEVEVLRALSVISGELRALNLLALIRFKLGRFLEAREVYREIVSVAPQDAEAWLNLGLTALKMGQFEESIVDLEKAGSLRPNELRAWSYLGIAYARQGQKALAAAAFRRAGQYELAAEIDRTLEQDRVAEADSAAPAPAEDEAVSEPAETTPVEAEDGDGATAADSPAPVAAPELVDEPAVLDAVLDVVPDAVPQEGGEVESDAASDFTPGEIMSVSSFALSRLLPADSVYATITASRAGMVRLQVQDEAFVRGDSISAHTGNLDWQVARRRARGRLEANALGSEERPFYRVRGVGNVWLSLERRRLAALLLEDDIFYVREDRVVAFDGEVYWEAGRLPCSNVRLVQFRGRGRVALDVEGEPASLKLESQMPVTVSLARMLGWVGRVIPHSVGSTRLGAGDEVSCEGEGVVLIEGPERRL